MEVDEGFFGACQSAGSLGVATGIAVCGATGGVGTTSLAVNLGCVLAETGERELAEVTLRSIGDAVITTDPQLAYALAFGMIVVIAVTIVLYTLLQRRASRWLR